MAKILYAAGTTTHLRCFHTDYIERLKKEGHTVITMASGEDADINTPFEKKMFSTKNLSNIRRIKRIIKEEKFDCILLNTTLAAFNIRMALGRKRPVVVNFVHGYMFGEKPSGLKEKIFLMAEKFLKSKTDSIMVMNKEDYNVATEKKLALGEVVMTRGMGTALKETYEPSEVIRERFNSVGKYAICFVGELCRAKNQEILIRILPKLREQIPNAVLWFLGKGGSETELKELTRELGVEDSVHFMGYVNNPTDYVRASDIYVTPSRKEGLPFNVLEAMGTGKPLIATNIKGHRDLIEDGVTGLLYNKDDEAELLEKILKVYNGTLTPDKEKQIATYERYSKEAVFEETLGSMKRLLKLD